MLVDRGCKFGDGFGVEDEVTVQSDAIDDRRCRAKLHSALCFSAPIRPNDLDPSEVTLLFVASI